MANLASLIREAERVRGAVRVVGPEPIPEPLEAIENRYTAPLQAVENRQPAPSLSFWESMVEEESVSPQNETDSSSTVRLSEEQMHELRSVLAPPPEVMTLSEAALYLRVGRSSLLDLVHDDGLPATKLAGKWRFKRSALDQWLQVHLSYHHRDLK